MINLLPTKQFVVASAEYRTRRLVVIGGFVLAWIVMAAIIIFSLYILVHTERGIVEEALAVKKSELAKTSTGGLEVDFSKQVSGLATEVKLLVEAEKGRILILDYLRVILAAKPAGVKITSFLSDGKVVQISGAASTRRSLLAFLDALRTQKTFTKVDSPVSNLIKEVNQDFIISLTLAK